jgi:hypothetical protein
MSDTSKHHGLYITIIGAAIFFGIGWLIGFIYTCIIVRKIKSHDPAVYQTIFPQGWFYHLFIYSPSFFFGSSYFFQFKPAISMLKNDMDPVLQSDGKKLHVAYLMFLVPTVVLGAVIILIGAVGFSGN